MAAVVRRAVDARAPRAAGKEGKRRGFAARPIWKRLRVLREERNMRNGRRMEAENLWREDWIDERNGREELIVGA